MKSSVIRIALVALLLVVVSAPSYAGCKDCSYTKCFDVTKGGYKTCEQYSYGCFAYNVCNKVGSFCSDLDSSCGYAAMTYRGEMQLAGVSTKTAPKAAPSVASLR